MGGGTLQRERAAVSATLPALRADGHTEGPALARRARSERAALKRALRAGRLTLGEVAARRPGPLRDMPLFTLLGELPGMGQRRVERLNRRAIAARINLARTLGEASTATLGWLLAELGSVEPDELELAPEPSAAAEDDQRDWRAVALSLDRLIREHERSVRDESLPAERWAWADERLHNARATIMGSRR
jgi:hypothetical protein